MQANYLNKLRNIRRLDRYADFSPLAPLVYLFKDHRKPGHLKDTIADYRNFKKNSSFLREHQENFNQKGKKVLAVSLTNFLYQVKLEGMLLKALELAGCQTYVLTWRHFFWPKKYFELFGIKNILFFEDWIKRYRSKSFREALKALPKEDASFQKVKKWQFENCRLGQQVLSTIARRIYGTPKLGEPGIHELFSFFLEKQAKVIYAARDCLEQVKPDIVIFNEANDSVYGALFDLSYNSGSDVIQFVQPFRDDALIFKRFNQESKGMHPNSLSLSTFDRIKQLEWSQNHEKALWDEFQVRYSGNWFLSSRNQPGKLGLEKEVIIDKLSLEEKKKNAVIFSHVLWDANLFYGEDLFEDYEEWFIETLKAACANNKLNWLIKMHPANIWKRSREGVKGKLREIVLIKKNIGTLPKHVHLLYPDTEINTISLFKFTDYGVTVRGTVGMELPCFGKPVFTAGTGRYSGLGFTIDSSTKEEYLDKLLHIQNFDYLSESQTLLAKKHAYAVFNLRPWRMESFKANFNYRKKGIHPLDHNLSVNIKSFKELSGAVDLKKFSNWVLNSDTVDYLDF